MAAGEESATVVVVAVVGGTGVEVEAWGVAVAMAAKRVVMTQLPRQATRPRARPRPEETGETRSAARRAPAAAAAAAAEGALTVAVGARARVATVARLELAPAALLRSELAETEAEG